MALSVQYKLPFCDECFDLVRMANLAMAIPASDWEFVLAEVKRVLKPAGRVEIIDDKLFFPVTPEPFYVLQYDKRSGIQLRDGVLSRGLDYADMRSTANMLESQFTRMLKETHNINPDLETFLPGKLKKTFSNFRTVSKEKLTMPWSPEQAQWTQHPVRPKFKIAINGFFSESPSDSSGSLARSGTTRSVTNMLFSAFQIAPATPPRHANRGSDDDTYPHRFFPRYQPPGLVQGNSKLLRCDRSALDFWACHGMHLLLASGPKLAAYMEDSKSTPNPSSPIESLAEYDRSVLPQITLAGT